MRLLETANNAFLAMIAAPEAIRENREWLREWWRISASRKAGLARISELEHNLEVAEASNANLTELAERLNGELETTKSHDVIATRVSRKWLDWAGPIVSKLTETVAGDPVFDSMATYVARLESELDKWRAWASPLVQSFENTRNMPTFDGIRDLVASLQSRLEFAERTHKESEADSIEQIRDLESELATLRAKDEASIQEPDVGDGWVLCNLQHAQEWQLKGTRHWSPIETRHGDRQADEYLYRCKAAQLTRIFPEPGVCDGYEFCGKDEATEAITLQYPFGWQQWLELRHFDFCMPGNLYRFRRPIAKPKHGWLKEELSRNAAESTPAQRAQVRVNPSGLIACDHKPAPQWVACTAEEAEKNPEDSETFELGEWKNCEECECIYDPGFAYRTTAALGEWVDFDYSAWKKRADLPEIYNDGGPAWRMRRREIKVGTVLG